MSILLAFKAVLFVFSVLCGVFDFVVGIWALFWLFNRNNFDDWGVR